MDGRGDGVVEAASGVRGEVHGDLGPRGERAHDVDVEEHLAVGRVGITDRRVLGAVDGDRGDRRLADAEAGEVRRQIGGLVPAAQFDDGDGLARPLLAGREVVELADLVGAEGRARGAGLHGALGLRLDAEVGPGLRAVVEAEHGLDDVGQVGGDEDGTGPAPVAARGVGEAAQLHVERVGELRGGAAQRHRAGRRVHVVHGQPGITGERLDPTDVVRRGGAGGGQFVAC